MQINIGGSLGCAKMREIYRKKTRSMQVHLHRRSYRESPECGCGTPYWRRGEWVTVLVVVVVQSLSHVWLFAIPWTVAHQTSLSLTISQSLLKFMFIESVMPSNHLILCHPLLLQPSISPNIRVLSNKLVLLIRWPKYWSFSLVAQRIFGGKESTCQCKRPRYDPSVGKISWRRKRQSTPVFLPGKSHGQGSLGGYSPWGHKRVGYNLATKQPYV